MRIYLDTVIVIYDVESHPEFAPLVRRRLSNGSNEFFITEIIRMECLVHPLRLDDQARVRAFESYFQQLCNFVPVNRAVAEQSAGLRAKYQWLKTPDALHLAAAIVGGCEVFLTNDHRLDRVAEIPVEVLNP